MLCEAFGEHSLSLTVVSEWHSRFKAGWVSIEDDKRSGQPSTRKTTENVEKIRELLHEDCRQTIHELPDTIGISYGVCQEILTALFTKGRFRAYPKTLSYRNTWISIISSIHACKPLLLW
jgi:hypothetical protein